MAVARWYQTRGELCFLALERTAQNLALAEKFTLPAACLQSPGRIMALLYAWPTRPITVHLVNVSLKSAFLAAMTAIVRGRVVADWDEWATRIPAPVTRKLMWRAVEALMFFVADTFLVASKFLQVEIRQKLERNRDVVYIPYGFDLPEDTAAAVLGELPAGRRYLAYVGSFAANYAADLDELFRATQAGAAEQTDLLVIGDGELLPKLRESLGHRLEQVHFLGRMSPAEVDGWLRHPQVVAGFLPLQATRQNLARCPNKLFHYIRASLPVVTSPIGEALEALGARGVYYDFGDSIGLSRAIGEATRLKPAYELNRYTWAARMEGLGTIRNDGDTLMAPI